MRSIDASLLYLRLKLLTFLCIKHEDVDFVKLNVMHSNTTFLYHLPGPPDNHNHKVILVPAAAMQIVFPCL